MKKYIVALLVCGSVLLAQNAPADQAAAPAKKHGPVLTDEQKAIIAKYDTNHDGKLSKEERAKMTPEDAAKLPPPPDRKKKKQDQ